MKQLVKFRTIKQPFDDVDGYLQASLASYDNIFKIGIYYQSYYKGFQLNKVPIADVIKTVIPEKDFTLMYANSVPNKVFIYARYKNNEGMIFNYEEYRLPYDQELLILETLNPDAFELLIQTRTEDQMLLVKTLIGK